MSTQWQGLLQNLGQWQGSFTELSPEGDLCRETPSQVTLTLSADPKTIDFCLQRFPSDAPAQETHLHFTYPGPGRGVPFFPQGAFSQGSLQWSPLSQFGAELAMIWGDRRLRLVLMFDASPQLSRITLIREHRADAGAEASSSLQISDLVGDWQGEALTLYADGRDLETTPTALTVAVSRGQLHQRLHFGDHTLETVGDITGSQIAFVDGTQPRYLQLLPGGASCLYPQAIAAGQPFFLEAGWLIEANLRQRMMRSYSAHGEWVSLTLITERRQG